MTTTATPTTTSTTVRRATTADVPDIAQSLSMGFTDDPWARWVFPHDDSYAEYSTRYFAFWTALAIENGNYVWLAEGLGALVNIPSDALDEIRREPGWTKRLADAAGPYADRVQAWDAASEAHQPPLPPHIYGAYGAVRPEHRNKGVGRAIFSACWDYTGSQGLGYYGESTSPSSFRLYSSLGACTAGDRFYLPGDDSSRAAELIPYWVPPASDASGPTRCSTAWFSSPRHC